MFLRLIKFVALYTNNELMILNIGFCNRIYYFLTSKNLVLKQVNFHFKSREIFI